MEDAVLARSIVSEFDNTSIVGPRFCAVLHISNDRISVEVYFQGDTVLSKGLFEVEYSCSTTAEDRVLDSSPGVFGSLGTVHLDDVVPVIRGESKLVVGIDVDNSRLVKLIRQLGSPLNCISTWSKGGLHKSKGPVAIHLMS